MPNTPSRPRAGQQFIYFPRGLFDLHDPKTNLQKGEVVEVVRLHGAPAPGTMGHCHVNRAETGQFAGLVLCTSLCGTDDEEAVAAALAGGYIQVKKSRRTLKVRS